MWISCRMAISVPISRLLLSLVSNVINMCAMLLLPMSDDWRNNFWEEKLYVANDIIWKLGIWKKFFPWPSIKIGKQICWLLTADASDEKMSLFWVIRVNEVKIDCDRRKLDFFTPQDVSATFCWDVALQILRWYHL